MVSRARVKKHSLKRWLTGASQPLYGYDGINVDAPAIARLFPHASFVGGYDNGWTWSAADWDLFPHAKHVHIVTQAHFNSGDVLDVEAGDALPSQAEGWIRARKAAGYHKPTIYCSLSTVPAVRAGTGPYVLGKDYDLWVAHWTGRPHVAYPGAVVTQWVSTHDYDANVSYSAAWPERTAPGPAPKPKPKPAPGPSKQPVLRAGDTGAGVVLLQTRLNVFKAKLAVDGIFGPKTLAAVRSFQKTQKITVDGIVGPQTWGKLGNYTAAVPFEIAAPPYKGGPARHKAHGSVTLHAAASHFRTTVDAVVAISLKKLDAKNKQAFVEYISTGSGPADPMPKNLIYWTPK